MDCFTTESSGTTRMPGTAPTPAVRDMSPALLVRQARRDNQQAVAELYRRAWPSALARVRAQFGSDEAEDAVAEGFARAFAHLDQLRDPAAVEAWLTRSAVRAWLDLARRRQRVQPAGAPTELPPAIGPPTHCESVAERFVAGVDRAVINSCIVQLPEDLRQMVCLRYIAGLSVHEVAARMALPEGTVRRRCFDARLLLRQRFTPSPAAGDGGVRGGDRPAVPGRVPGPFAPLAARGRTPPPRLSGMP
jgi:RNA polymerase sigma-70 factor (ECF subfamily)